MAASEVLTGIDLQVADIADAMSLSMEAGWNQTAEDWHHFITQGRVHGLRNEQGRLVASAAALPYDGPFGFISMVLVTADHRRRGLATSLVEQCIAGLSADGLVPVLDATAAGAEVYRQQGFLPQFSFVRWQGEAQGYEAIDSDSNGCAREAGMKSPQLAAPTAQALEAMVALDTDVTGAGRSALLTDFISRAGTYSVMAGAGQGFAMIRRGQRAWQAGPVVADNEAGALDLIRQLLDRVRGTVFIDVLSAWKGIATFLFAHGFSVQRSFTRMAHQHVQPFGDPTRQFAVAGPEFG